MRLREVQKWRKEQSREERKRNIVIRRIDITGRDIKDEVMKILKEIGGGIELEEVRKVGRRGRRSGQNKNDGAEDKGNERKEKVSCTEEEAGRRFDVGEKDTMEDRESAAKRKGRKVRIGYRKAWIDGKL